MNLIIKIKDTEKSGKIPAFAYDRVSTTKQENEGMSLEYQARQALKYAADNNIEIVQVYSSAESAFKEGRKNFNRMLDDAVTHGIKDIIFKNTDRLSRNEVDWSRCKKLAREKGLRIHLYELGTVFKVDSSAEEEVFLDNTAVFAKYWSNKISQSVRRAYVDKRERGIRPGKCPVGYKYNKDAQTYSIDPDKVDMIRYIFDTFDSENISVETLADRVNEHGYRTQTGKLWKRPYLHAILRNPFYAGKFILNDEFVEGVQEAYIPWENYLKRLDRMGEKWFGKKKREFEFPLANLLITDTGLVLTGEQKKEKYNYYSHKTESGREYYKEEQIFGWIDSEIEKIRYTADFAGVLKETFKELIEGTVYKQDGVLKSVNKKIDILREKQLKTFDLFYDEDIPREPLKRKVAEIEAELKVLEKQRVKAAEIRIETFYEIADVIDAVRNFPSHFISLDTKFKSEFLRSMAQRVVIKEKAAQIIWKQPFCWIIETVPFEAVLNGTVMHSIKNDLRTLCGDILLRWVA